MNGEDASWEPPGRATRAEMHCHSSASQRGYREALARHGAEPQLHDGASGRAA